MPFTITQTGPDIPPGTYPATLAGVEPYQHETYGEGRMWKWLVEKADGIEEFGTITSNNTGPKSKAYAWLKVLLGRELRAGETIDDPTGTRVLLVIGKNEKGFPKIEAVLPYSEPQQVLDGVPR